MPEPNDGVSDDALGRALARRQASGELLQATLASLTPAQRAELAKVAADEQLRLDVAGRRADQLHFDSSRDLVNTVKTAEALEQTGTADYEVVSHVRTASGSTRVRVKRNNGTIIIVIAVVIGLLALLLLR